MCLIHTRAHTPDVMHESTAGVLEEVAACAGQGTQHVRCRWVDRLLLVAAGGVPAQHNELQHAQLVTTSLLPALGNLCYCNAPCQARLTDPDNFRHSRQSRLKAVTVVAITP